MRSHKRRFNRVGKVWLDGWVDDDVRSYKRRLRARRECGNRIRGNNSLMVRGGRTVDVWLLVIFGRGWRLGDQGRCEWVHENGIGGGL